MGVSLWTTLTNKYKAAVGGWWDESLTTRVADRLDNGDVTETQYGWRVALRSDLGDNRDASGANAYWPEGEHGCMCWYNKASGSGTKTCSHALAVRVKRWVLRTGGGWI